jgi:hypothetical protein
LAVLAAASSDRHERRHVSIDHGEVLDRMDRALVGPRWRMSADSSVEVDVTSGLR